MTTRKIARALLSVSDKTGLAEFAHGLRQHGVEIVSTGGTAKLLRDAGIEVIEVAEITGLPEMMDGRVKTLHPKIHGGLLAVRENEAHLKALAEHAIPTIDLLAVNLYPFEATVAGGADFATCIENIDIGGPAMIRAAAKNHDGVTVVVDPADYAVVLAEMAANGGATTLALRKQLAARAFARTASYDAAIASWFAGQLGESTPSTLAIAGRLAEALRYGENPHQWAAFYRDRRQAVRRRHRAPGPGQGAQLQQSQRHRRRLRAGRRVRSQGERSRRDHQARQSVRRGDRPTRWPKAYAQGAGLRPDQRVRRHRRAEPRRSTPTPRARSSRSSPKSSSRPAPATRRRPSSPRRRICACCWPAGCPTPRRKVSFSARSPAAFWCNRATMPWSPRTR